MLFIDGRCIIVAEIFPGEFCPENKLLATLRRAKYSS